MKETLHDFLIWIGVVGAFGAIGATARYINDLGREDQPFRFRAWLATSIVGVAVSIFTGLICRHFAITDELAFALVGIAAISAKELIAVAPKLATGVLERLSKTFR